MEVTATVIQLTGHARRRLVVFQQTLGGCVESLTQQACTMIVVFLTQFIQRHGNSKELAQRIPAQMVFLQQLLHVLGCRTASAGFVEPTTVQQGNN